MIDSLKHLVNEAIEASEGRNLSEIEKARMLDKAISECYNQIKTRQLSREEAVVSEVKSQIWVVSALFIFPIGILVGNLWFGC